MESYSDFAKIYDFVMKDEVDYLKWTDFLMEIFEKYNIKPELGCDIGCGTGTFTYNLSNKGIDMIGIDVSMDMLNVAKEKYPDILFLNQDMREFELYGTVDIITCMLNAVNYLESEDEIEDFFLLVKNYLNPDGIFVLDMDTKYKLMDVMGNNIHIHDSDDLYYVWESQLVENERAVESHIDFFVKTDGSYYKISEMQKEWIYEIDDIKRIIKKTGLRLLEVTSPLQFKEVDKEDLRAVFVLRKEN